MGYEGTDNGSGIGTFAFVNFEVALDSTYNRPLSRVVKL